MIDFDPETAPDPLTEKPLPTLDPGEEPDFGGWVVEDHGRMRDCADAPGDEPVTEGYNAAKDPVNKGLVPAATARVDRTGENG